MAALALKLGAAVTALLLGVAGVAFTVTRNHDYVISGHFISAEGLTAGNDVVLSGVRIGTVEGVRLAGDADPGGGAIVLMRVDPRFAPLRRGTRAEVRSKGFLGNQFVELTTPNQTGETIPSGGSIPLQDTAAPVSLDQVMDIFDPDTRARIKTLTLEGGKTFAGNNGQNVNEILAGLPALTKNVSSVAGNLDQSQQQLDALQVEFDRVAQQIAGEDRSLRSDLRNGARILDTLAAHQAQLQAELVNGSAGLTALNAGLRGHEQDLNTILKQIPAFEDRQKALTDASQLPLSEIDPCIGDIVAAIDGLRASTAYKMPAGSSDGAGYMLRVYSFVNLPAAPSSGEVHPRLACQG